MALLVLVGVAVDETVNARSTKGSCCNALALGTRPGTRNLAAAEGLDGTGYQRSFGGLFPLLRLAALAVAAARSRVVAAAAAVVVIVAAVAVVATVVATSGP